jgi:ADP-heptose:LPS heptosyltransferase
VVWRKEDPTGNESGKMLWELVPYTRGRGLDLGCGPHKAFPHFIGVDDYTDKRLFGIDVKPDVPADVRKLDIFGSASMDFVFSSHCLEHLVDYKGALREWWRVIKPGGHLCLYLPHADHYPRIGAEGANIDHKHDFMPDDIVSAMRGLGGWDMLRNEVRTERSEYSFFQVFRKRTDKQQIDLSAPVAGKRAAVVRYGAFGDAIQASSILPGLKEQGYHVTFYTTPRAHAVLKHDPHIDAFYIQDTDQVPNVALPEFWAWEAKKYDKWINLSESVEGVLLALPGRANHEWPVTLRRKMLGGTNYIEFAHDLAQVPAKPAPKFYSTEEERAWAKKERARIGGDFLVMYSCAGSSVHKVWPWMDSLFARILLRYPTARILTVGDEMSQLLEQGWEQESRVVRMSGKYTIRQSMALLDVVDMLIGPETGMLNAAGHMSVPKVLMLSHSSHANLSRDWRNCAVVEPENTHCYPCHRLHYSFEHCNRDESTGTALCASNTSLERVWSAFEDHMKRAA